MKSLEERIFQIDSEESFLQTALEVYQFQRKHNHVYKEYVDFLGWEEPTSLEEIPFLPISFFKTHKVVSGDFNPEITFLSSGTGGDRSRHLVKNIQLYENSFNPIYDQFLGKPEDQVILALLPNYIEQGQSSLVYMVDKLIERTQNELSGFVLGKPEEIAIRYKKALVQNKKVIIFGVSYALLDLAELNIDLSEATIIETGGMKGRRKEISKNELHHILRNGFNGPQISSEYGMTELLSQAYSNKDGLFESYNWMKILIRQTNDPFAYVKNGKTGGINVIDLANLYSCSFIATQDLGKQHGNFFEIMGRFDHSDLRGCNLLVQ